MQEKENQSVIGYIRSNPHLTNEQIAQNLGVSAGLVSKLRKYARLSTNKK